MKFTELNLHEKLLKGIEGAGFIDCMPVQAKTLAQTLNGRDLAVQSQTGTGKTAAFLISIFQPILERSSNQQKKALIIAPTRELAVQIEKEARLLGRYLNVKVGCFFGGVRYASQEKSLREGVDIIIGTPGRLLDFGQQGKLDFMQMGILIIDEADRLFDMGFLPDIRRMLRKMPAYNARLTMLFSATLDYRCKELAWEFMNAPVEIEITPEQITVENIEQKLYHVSAHEKMKLLLGILKKEVPGNTLIFTNTKQAAHEVANRLKRNGYDCQYIMGDLPQKQRLKIIDGVKSGSIKFLVATEVAARGLHIDDLELVINYDLPVHSENYVHRIGRTARAGKPGKAISLACENYVCGLEGIEAFTNMKIPVEWADDDLYKEDKSAGMRFRLARPDKSVSREKMVRNHTVLERPSGSSRRNGRRPSRSQDSAARTAKPKTETRNVVTLPSPSKPDVAEGRKRRPGKKSHRRSVSTRPGPKSSQAERFQYYRKKYGDNFAATHKPPPEEKHTHKKSLLGKIIGIFIKKA
jgi:ATP-dependent RNA helicase RhlB